MTRFDTNKVNRYLVLILLIAFVIRMAVAIYLGDMVSGLSGAHDEISYSMLGERFATGHGMTFPEAWYPWIEADAPQSYYSFTISFFFAGIYKLFGYHPLAARVITGIMSTCIVWLIFLIGKQLFGSAVGLLASAVAALYAYLIFYGVTLVTETPFTLTLLIALYLAIRMRTGEVSGFWAWFTLGVVLAVTVLLRMAIIFFIPILLLWLYYTVRKTTSPWMLAVPLGLIILAVLPLTIRNYLLWHQFLLLEAQFGHVLWNGNHPGHMGNFHPFAVFPIPNEVLALHNDVLITNALLRMAIQNILAAPWNFVLLTVTRLREFFVFWPTEDSTLQANLLRVFSFGLIVPFALYGLIANLRRFGELAPIYLFFVIHTGIYAVTWTMVRYRVPLDPFFILFAAYTLHRIYEMGRRQRSVTVLPRQVAV